MWAGFDSRTSAVFDAGPFVGAAWLDCYQSTKRVFGAPRMPVSAATGRSEQRRFQLRRSAHPREARPANREHASDNVPSHLINHHCSTNVRISQGLDGQLLPPLDPPQHPGSHLVFGVAQLLHQHLGWRRVPVLLLGDKEGIGPCNVPPPESNARLDDHLLR